MIRGKLWQLPDLEGLFALVSSVAQEKLSLLLKTEDKFSLGLHKEDSDRKESCLPTPPKPSFDVLCMVRENVWTQK